MGEVSNLIVDMSVAHSQEKIFRKNFSRIGWALCVMLLSSSAMQYLLIFLTRAFLPEILTASWYTWALNVLSLYLTGFPLFLLVIMKLPNFPAAEKKSIRPWQFGVLVVICLSASYVCSYISSFINFGVSAMKGETVENPVAFLQDENYVLLFIFSVIVAPIMEEVIFRGVLLSKLRPYGEGFAAFTSGFVFALFHGNISQMLYAFVVGFIFAYIALRCGTILYSILLHMSVNLVGTLLPRILLLDIPILTRILSMLVMAIIIIGIVLVVLSRKSIHFAPASIRLISGKKGFDVLLGNPGMIVYMVLCLISVVLWWII